MHPLTLVVTNATTLEIVNGNLLVDFRDFKKALTDTQKQTLPFMKVLIQETSVTFKVNNMRMRERYEEYQSKFSALKVEAAKNSGVVGGSKIGVGRTGEWNENPGPLLGDEISMDASDNEESKQMPYSMRGIGYVTMNKGILSMPMMVIENDSVLELRDCMVR